MRNVIFGANNAPGARLITEPTELEQGFRFSLDVTVRFADLDTFSHVNNAVYLTYCEMARIAYYNFAVGRVRRPDETFILAHSDIDYRSPVLFGDPVRVLTRASRMGTKSFDLEYRILAGPPDNERLAAESHSVQVMYDYEHGKTIAVPAEVTKALEEFEQRSLRRQ